MVPTEGKDVKKKLTLEGKNGCFSLWAPRLCSSSAWWPVAPNFCSQATRRS